MFPRFKHKLRESYCFQIYFEIQDLPQAPSPSAFILWMTPVHCTFFSDFSHLLKNVRNAFLDTGFNMPDGRVHADYIKEAWKSDNESVTLKVMPHLSRLHLFPNGSEKQWVGPALLLVSDEVLKGLLFYRKQIEWLYGPGNVTEAFIMRFSKLIRIMTSRVPATAFRPESPEADFLREFLVFF